MPLMRNLTGLDCPGTSQIGEMSWTVVYFFKKEG